MEEDGRKDQPEHICIHEGDWGKTNRTLDDHERRIKNNETETSKFNGLAQDILLQIEGLRGDLKLTKEKNGTQDKELEGIQKKERAKILAEGQRKGLWMGAIIGAIASGLATLVVMIVFRSLEIFTFL